MEKAIASFVMLDAFNARKRAIGGRYLAGGDA
jgi:hypothetical protein